MNWTDMFSWLCLALYALATVASFPGVLGRSPRVKRLAYLLCASGFLAHTIWLLISLFSGIFSNVSRGFYLLPLAWFLAAAGLVMSRRQRQEIILHFVAPWAFFLCACALGFSNAPAAVTMTGPLLWLHLAGIFVGIGVMAVAAGAGSMFLWQEKAIKTKSRIAGFRRDLPALSSLDAINAMATRIGFPCYSLGLLCGFLWSRIAWGSMMAGDLVKGCFSIAILLVYALLFHQRQALGWRGRKPAILAIVIFIASLVSLFIVNTFFPSQHGF